MVDNNNQSFDSNNNDGEEASPLLNKNLEEQNDKKPTKVEGLLAEFTNVPEHDIQQSPEKAMSGSPKAPQTSARTSTRIRTSTASARQKMESTTMEIVEQQEKNNVTKTPATRGSRRMAPAVSARGKVETQNEQKSVQRVYNTRSAVRLLEKGMEGLGLKEKERVRPLKMDVEIEDVETEDESV